MALAARDRLNLVLLMVVVAAAAVALSAALIRHVPGIGLVGRSVAVFVTTRLVGDGLGLLLWPRDQILFLEDLMRGAAWYAGLGLLAAGAVALAEVFVGGRVDPAVPAVAAYLVGRWINDQSGSGRSP